MEVVIMNNNNSKEIRFVGITKKTETNRHAKRCTDVAAFEMEFNSINHTFEEDFLEILECYKKQRTFLNVITVREHRYKVISEGSDGNVFGILFRMYMSYRNNLWMEIETEEKFEPLIDFVVELEAA